MRNPLVGYMMKLNFLSLTMFPLVLAVFGCSRDLPKTYQECMVYALSQPQPEEASSVCTYTFPGPAKTPAPPDEMWYRPSSTQDCVFVNLGGIGSAPVWCDTPSMSEVDHKWYVACGKSNLFHLDPFPQGYVATLVVGSSVGLPTKAVFYKEQAACLLSSKP